MPPYEISLQPSVEKDLRKLSAHKETKQPIQLQPGQVGTVLIDFDGQAFLIDFADNQGHTYTMETVPAHQFLLLHEPQLTNT